MNTNTTNMSTEETNSSKLNQDSISFSSGSYSSVDLRTSKEYDSCDDNNSLTSSIATNELDDEEKPPDNEKPPQSFTTTAYSASSIYDSTITITSKLVFYQRETLKFLSEIKPHLKILFRKLKPYKAYVVGITCFLVMSYYTHLQNRSYYSSPMKAKLMDRNMQNRLQEQHLRQDHEQYVAEMEMYKMRQNQPPLKRHHHSPNFQYDNYYHQQNHHIRHAQPQQHLLDQNHNQLFQQNSNTNPDPNIIQHPLQRDDRSKFENGLFINLTPVPIPKMLQDSLANIDEPLQAGDIPLFFHVPRSGGTTIKNVMQICLNMNMIDTAESNNLINPRNESSFQMKESQKVDSISLQDPYQAQSILQFNNIHSPDINNNTTTNGKDKDQNSPNDNHYRGRMFVMLRHPMDRVLSSFYYFGKAHWETNYDPELAHISFTLFSKQNRTEHNYLLRTLTNEWTRDEFTLDHFETAKQILRSKCLIGLLSDKDHSLRRFEHYFGWNTNSERTRQCQERMMHWDWAGKFKHPGPAELEGSPGWEMLVQRNQWDLKLYEYATLLFQEQSALFQYHHEGHVMSRMGGIGPGVL